ncbi:MAG TPA: YdeI/OmpD-associated family protein [Candidatus Dormibacteraeota bacterium]|nr:YdeI/OmpD-associated family protein [Candidatus Dormibacteraeota bacterium]
MRVPAALPVLHFESSDAWEAWLADSHATAPGVWLKIAKKGSGTPSVDYSQAVDAALCFGWIDGQKDSHDAAFWLQRFTPRRRASRWSRVNTERAEALIQAGRMRPAGLREVETAKADGRWQAAYHSQSTATVPADLGVALEANPRAAAFFATLDRGNRYAILYRVADAKRPETRARRIATLVAMLADDNKLHP